MRKNVALWIVQGLLAMLFLFAGGMKLVLPLEAVPLIVGVLAASVAYGRSRPSVAATPGTPSRVDRRQSAVAIRAIEAR